MMNFVPVFWAMHLSRSEARLLFDSGKRVDELDRSQLVAYPDRRTAPGGVAAREHGRTKLVAMITEPSSIARFLTVLGERTDVAAHSPNRGHRTGRAPSSAVGRSGTPRSLPQEHRGSENRLSRVKCVSGPPMRRFCALRRARMRSTVLRDLAL